MDNSSGTNPGHVPVLLEEAVAALRPLPGGRFVDATFGGGGYARAILESAAAEVIGIDRDPEAVARGRALAAAEPRFTMVEGRFGELQHLLQGLGLTAVDGIVADLGVSSFQLAAPARGFAFQHDGPLDMRMGLGGPTAADLLAELEAGELARLFRLYGDEPQAARVARAIVARRRTAPLRRTRELRELVAAVKGRAGAKDPATQVFQALRIAVNDELGELERLLAAAAEVLVPGGRLVVVTFHSGEDRLVKRTIDAMGGRQANPSRHLPPAAHPRPRFAWAEHKLARPSPGEVGANPRARSAKLRVAVRLADRGENGATDPETGGGPASGGQGNRWRCAA